MLHLQSRGIVLPLSRNKPPIAVEAPPPAHMIEALERPAASSRALTQIAKRIADLEAGVAVRP